MDFCEKVMFSKPGKDELSIFWLGQAGFIIKSHDGQIIAVDPYLSDCVERYFGFKRLMAPVMRPGELDIDILLVTHHHEDHLDPDAVPIIMSNQRTRLIGSKTSVNICRDMKIPESRLTPLDAGEKTVVDGIEIKAVYADHGELAPDAIGFLLTIHGIKIYITGDTAYCPENMQESIASKPDIVILPINGEYGNLNGEDAAKLVRDTGAKVAIPCHFWTFAIHRGDPYEFQQKMQQYAPDCKVQFICQGEEYLYKKSGN